MEKTDKPSKYFILAFLFSTYLNCSIAWLTPSFSIPDESAHYLRSFEVSHGHWINSHGNIGISIPCSDYLNVVKQDGHVRVAFYQDSAEKMQPSPAECTVNTINTAGAYSPIPYIASAFGIRMAEKLGYDVNTRLRIGRLTNTIVTSLICFFAALAVQKYRLLIATFILLPTSIWLRASLSADALTITFCIGYLAYILHLIEKNIPIKQQIIISLTLLAIIFGSVKPIYGLLSFSSLILFKRIRQLHLDLGNLLVLALPGIAALIAGAIWALTADPKLIYINNFGGANPAMQWMYIWNNPIDFLYAVINTFRINHFFVAQALIPQWIVQHEQ